MARLFALLLLLLPGVALAQSYPVHQTTFVNDYAQVLDEAAENRVTNQLKSLREDLGVEATVLTLQSRTPFQTSGSMEQFATGLFNHWGIGNAERNDGILIMVLVEDRDMRIELGSGYGDSFNRAAQHIIDREMIPYFKDGDFATGIEAGTTRTIEWIARPHAQGNAPPEQTQQDGGSRSGSGTILMWIFGAIVAGFLVVGKFGTRIADRFRTCPKCGRKGLHTDKETLVSATRQMAGQGRRTVTCRHCDYHDRSDYAISRIRRSSSSSGGSFGGGSSSGGGASGRW